MHLVMLSASHLVAKLSLGAHWQYSRSWLVKTFWRPFPLKVVVVRLWGTQTIKGINLLRETGGDDKYHSIRITSSENLFWFVEHHQYHAIVIQQHCSFVRIAKCASQYMLKGCNRKKISAVLHQLKLGSISVPKISVFWEKLKEKGKKESHGCKLDFFQGQI